MTFFTQLKCAFCLRRSCHARYKIGKLTYYPHIGCDQKECPKKLEKYPWYPKQINGKLILTEERLTRHQNKNMDNNNKNEE